MAWATVGLRRNEYNRAFKLAMRQKNSAFPGHVVEVPSPTVIGPEPTGTDSELPHRTASGGSEAQACQCQCIAAESRVRQRPARSSGRRRVGLPESAREKPDSVGEPAVALAAPAAQLVLYRWPVDGWVRYCDCLQQGRGSQI